MSKYNTGGCGCGTLVYILAGYWAVDYLTNLMGNDLFWLWDVLLGIILGWGAIWVALFLYIF